jgi:hypothetical protein
MTATQAWNWNKILDHDIIFPRENDGKGVVWVRECCTLAQELEWEKDLMGYKNHREQTLNTLARCLELCAHIDFFFQ